MGCEMINVDSSITQIENRISQFKVKAATMPRNSASQELLYDIANQYFLLAESYKNKAEQHTKSLETIKQKAQTFF